jgi:DNA sulfur modification protein DndD
MKLSILGWRTQGLRCPDVSIDLQGADKQPHRVSLLQMDNGTGKTTTLKLIRAALDGSAAQWPQSEVKGLRRPGATHAYGAFILRLSIDQELLTVTVHINFDTGIARYETQFRTRNVDRFEPPASVARFLRPDFVQMFIFDGEYAKDLFDPNKSEARKAVTNLFQLYLFEEIAGAADDFLTARIREIGTQSRTSAAVQKLRTELSNAEKQYTERKTASDQASESLKQNEARLKSLTDSESSLESRSEELNKTRADAAHQLGLAHETAASALDALAKTIRLPLYTHSVISLRLDRLLKGLEKLRLPANTASQWFDELAAPDNIDCICGRPLGEAERKCILSMKTRYLGTDVHSVLNVVKHHLSSALAEHAEEVSDASKTLPAAAEAAKHSEGKKREFATRLRAAEQALAENGTDAERELHTEIVRLKIKQDELQQALRAFSLPSGPHSVKAAQLAKDKLMIELAKATATAELNSKVKILRNILRDAAKIADESLRRDVQNKSNARLLQILHKDPLSIKSIGNSLELAGQAEASIGQSLAVGYTFLVTLLHEANIKFPLVVDSPAGSLGHTIRREVAKMIPSMSEQFVALTISTEREGFVDTLADTAGAAGGHPIQFLTLVRITEGSAALLAKAPKDRTVMTADGALVDSRSFFETFDIKREDAPQ